MRRWLSHASSARSTPPVDLSAVLPASALRGRGMRRRRLHDRQAQDARGAEPLLLQADAQVLRRAAAGEDVAQQAAAHPAAHLQLVALAQQLERDELLQVQQRRGGEVARLPPRDDRREHALHAVHDQDLAEVDAVVLLVHHGVRARQAAQALVGVPEAAHEGGVARRAARGAHHPSLRVEQHDGDLEDRGDPVDQLSHVLLLHDELEQLDLERRGAAQRLHVAGRRGRGLAGVRVVLEQRRLELLGVAAHLVLQPDGGLEQPEVRLADVHRRLRAVHQGADDLVEPRDLGLQRRDVPGVGRVSHGGSLRPPAATRWRPRSASGSCGRRSTARRRC